MRKAMKTLLCLGLILSLFACSEFKPKKQLAGKPIQPAAEPLEDTSAESAIDHHILGSPDENNQFRLARLLKNIELSPAAFTEEEMDGFVVFAEHSFGEILGLVFAKGEFLGVERLDGLAELAEKEDVAESLEQDRQNYCVIYAALSLDDQAKIQITAAPVVLRHVLSENSLVTMTDGTSARRSIVIVDGWHGVDLSGLRSSRPQIKSIKCVKFTAGDATLYESELLAALGEEAVQIEGNTRTAPVAAAAEPDHD